MSMPHPHYEIARGRSTRSLPARSTLTMSTSCAPPRSTLAIPSGLALARRSPPSAFASRSQLPRLSAARARVRAPPRPTVASQRHR